jgi:hypothetical protein
MRSLRASSPGVCGQHTGAMTDTEAVRIYRGELGAVEGVQRAAADEPNELIVRRYLCIHFPHKLSELMRGMLAHPVMVDAMRQLIGPDIKAMQSMLVAGTDPYAYKGTVDVMRPHVRPDGEGGCLR